MNIYLQTTEGFELLNLNDDTLQRVYNHLTSVFGRDDADQLVYSDVNVLVDVPHYFGTLSTHEIIGLYEDLSPILTFEEVAEKESGMIKMSSLLELADSENGRIKELVDLHKFLIG